MRAIITGAAGFIGQELVKELRKSEMEVLAIIRQNHVIPEEWKNDSKIEIAYCDPDNSLSIIKGNTFSGKGDIFYHFGWHGTSGEARANIDQQLRNVKSTCDAVELAARLGCTTFVNAGSIMEYEIIKLMTTGNHVPGISTIYSTAKLTADYMGRALANHFGIAFMNIVISNIYGVGEKSARFLNTTIHKMMKNESIPLTHGNQLYDFVYITDAVRLIRIVGTSGHNNEIYYIGNSTQKPLKQYLFEMKEILQSSSMLAFGAVPLTSPSLTYTEFDTQKIEKEFHIRPEITFKDGILKMKKWIMEQENE